LSLVDQIIIVLTTLVASVGAGGIPSGSFVTLPLIFTAVRLPVDKIPILLTIDWFLDRCRTTSNVLGDMAVAVLLDRVWPRGSGSADLESLAIPAETIS
jgi:DAACS family dicarboxylate/amino acid:cation (Na+ or H+) symporter